MIQLNFRDARPFYLQIKENLRQLIVTGALVENDKLPSVREMASSLAINPNTIQRAYRELEAEGYVYSLSGRGTFVAKLAEAAFGREKELLEEFDKTVTELLYLSVSVEELQKRIHEIEERRGNE